MAVRAARDDALRSDFITYWRAPYESRGPVAKREADWATFHQRFSQTGLRFPPNAWGDGDLDRWLRMVFTAQTGHPEGWNYKRLPEVAHHLHDQFPDKLVAFFHMLNHYGHADTLRAQDANGKWRAKAQRTRQEIAAGSQRYAGRCAWDDLLAFLFPEIFHAFFKVT